jgi:hypothetical protein
VAEVYIEFQDAAVDLDVRVTPSIPGPPGPPGPPGDADAMEYVHTQSTPSTTWAITNPFPFQPVVVVTDSAGNEVIVNVRHVSSTLVHVMPETAWAGTATLR